jgi:hypothetical protein
MIWRSTASILAAFLVAYVAVWFSPALMNWLGLNEFVFVGQVGLGIVALSALESVFRRLPEPGEHGDHDPG